MFQSPSQTTPASRDLGGTDEENDRVSSLPARDVCLTEGDLGEEPVARCEGGYDSDNLL